MGEAMKRMSEHKHPLETMQEYEPHSVVNRCSIDVHSGSGWDNYQHIVIFKGDFCQHGALSARWKVKGLLKLGTLMHWG